MPLEPLTRRRGRPRKFHRPSRSIALTLPNDVIAALQAIDPDLSRAIVRVTQTPVGEASVATATLANYGNRAVITVPSTRALTERTGVELVPLANGRALISFDERLSIEQLELRIGDALADLKVEAEDRVIFEALAEILKSARRSDKIALRPRTIIVLEWIGPGAEIDGRVGGRQAASA